MKAIVFLFAICLLLVTSINATEILFGGDVTLAKNITNQKDYFSNKAKEKINQADLFIWNCEFSGDSPNKKTKQFVFSVDAYEKLKGMRFDNGVALTANNHSFDGNTIGFKNLLKYLENNKIQYVGVRNISSIENNFLSIERNGKNYYILNFSPICHNSNIARTVPSWNDIIKYTDYINNIRKASDIVIVNIHDGIEKATSPSSRQINYAKELADKNVDIVSFTHSHTYIDPSKIRDTLVLWGMGNFIFGGNVKWKDNKDVRIMSVDTDNKTWRWIKGYTQNYKFDLY